MTFQYKRVLLVGATSGIGAAMADKFIQEGAKVIAVGRRQERLDAFVAKHGAERASAIKFDTTDRAGLDGFVNGVVQGYPDLDCVFFNSGVQSHTQLSRPDEVDLDAFHHEIDTNFSSIVNLTVKFLSHLQAKDYPTSMIVTGTFLSLVPAVVMPAYSSSKAALRAYFECLRRQNQGSSVKFIEILPPVVQTELHDYMGVERGRALGMPVDEFTDQAYAQLADGRDEVSVGGIHGAKKGLLERLLDARNELFDDLSNGLLRLAEP